MKDCQFGVSPVNYSDSDSDSDSMVKTIISCFRIFLPSFRRVWFNSDVFAQSYWLSKRVTNMNPGHVNEFAIFWLMNFTFREIHFLSNYSPPQKAINRLYQCIHRLYTSLYYPWSYYVTLLVVCLHPDAH